MLGRDDELSGRARARSPCVPRCRRRAARCALCLLDRDDPRSARRNGARRRLAGPGRTAARARDGGLRRALATCSCRASSSWKRPETSQVRPRLPAEAAAIAERFGDAGRACAGRSRPRPDAHQIGSGQGGPCSPRRDNGGGDRGRAVSGCHGHRLLRGDPGLAGGVRGAPRT